MLISQHVVNVKHFDFHFPPCDILTNITILPLEIYIFQLIVIFEFSIVLCITNRWTNPF